MKLKYIAFTILLLLASSVFAVEKSQLVANLKAGKTQTIVTYGTSLTRFGDWVDQLQEALNTRFPGQATVINSGEGSRYSQWGVDNLDEYVIKKNPDTVLIEFAINDAYLEYNTSVEQAKKNLIDMIDRLQQANKNCEVVLMTMNPSTVTKDRPNFPAYYQMYRDVAKGRKLLLIDNYLNWKKILDANRDLFMKYVPDGLHPNTEGSLNVITPQIMKSLGIDPYSKFVANLKAGKKQTLVTLGTSLTQFGDWVIQLQDALHARYPGQVLLVSSGASSMYSQFGVDHLDDLVLINKPDAVIIEYAFNDAYVEYKTSVEQARKNLMNMIERLRKANPECQIILATMNTTTSLPDRPNFTDYYQMYRDVAKEQHYMLIDHYQNWVQVLKESEDTFFRYVPDNTHPNLEGATKVITPQVLKSLGVDQDSKLVADLKAGKKQTIVVYSSSMSAPVYFVGAAIANRWPSQLRYSLDAHYQGLATVIDSKIPGKNSQWGLDNLLEQVINKKPTVVFLEFGSSDYAANIPVEQSHKNLLEMISRIQQADPTCQIISMIMDPSKEKVDLEKLTEYSLMYHEVANEQRLLSVDCFNNYFYASFTQGTINPDPNVPRSLIAPKILKALGINPFGKLVGNLKNKKPQTVVCYGTSLTAWGEWVKQLQAALDKKYPKLAKVINSGEPGMWSVWGMENLDERVLKNKPDLVTIEFGINDAYALHNTTVEQARANLENMINRIQKAYPNCEIVLMTMNMSMEREDYRPPVEPYYQMYRDVAKARMLQLIDHYPNWKKILDSDSALFNQYVPDTIHPGPLGCEKVITPEILKALGI